MSSTVFYSTIGTGNTVGQLLNNYNNVASEITTEVLRVPGSATQTGNLTLNGTFVTQTFILSSATSAAANTTNRLENRNGILFFNNDRVQDVPSLVVYAYVACGVNAGVFTTTTERFTFSTATHATQTQTTPNTRRETGALSDCKASGYFVGGVDNPVASIRLTFSTGNYALYTPADYPGGGGRFSSISDGIAYGYFSGGATAGGNPSTVQYRITYSTGILGVIGARLATTRWSHAGISDATLYGYLAGGATGADGSVSVATMERISLSSGIASATTSVLSIARSVPATCMDGSTYGYYSGGRSNITNYATTDRITFSSGVVAAWTLGNLSTVRTTVAGFSDGATFGYYSGGNSGVSVATVDRITFSSGSVAALTSANLLVARQQHNSLADFAI